MRPESGIGLCRAAFVPDSGSTGLRLAGITPPDMGRQPTTTAARTVKVSWSASHGQYRKYVGSQMGRSGTPRPKCWYLGGDEREAVRRAVELVAEWERLKRAGAESWPLMAAGGAASDAHRPKDDFVDADCLTVGEVCDLYLDSYIREAEANQIAWSTVHSTGHRLEWVRESLGVHSKVASLGEREIHDAVLFLARRPVARRRMHQTEDPQPLSVTTVVNCVRQMKAVLTWYAEMDGCTWEKPKRFERLFRLRKRKMMTPGEREQAAKAVVSADVATFKVDELTALWGVASNRMRLYILLGLNCDFTSSEIANLRTFEVFLEVPEPYAHRFRDKTGVEARWALWPETVEVLCAQKTTLNVEKRWLLTSYGNPLVEVTRRTRRDAIEQAWKRMLSTSGIERRLGFRYLRKTGADAIKRMGSLEESEMYLSHAEPGINKVYANRNWDRMWACLQQLRAELPLLVGSSYSARQIETEPARSSRSATGYRNVCYHGGKKRYYAKIMVDGVVRCSSYFPTAEEAARAAMALRSR
ncbi:MAG: hypothetical protein AAF108_02520 [Planctomycetota bacterium]